MTKDCLKKNFTDIQMSSNKLTTQHMVSNMEGTEGHKIKTRNDTRHETVLQSTRRTETHHKMQ